VFPDLIGAGKFAVGRLRYADTYGSDPSARIVVIATFEMLVTTSVILDTGAPWCILNPLEADVLNLSARADCSPAEPLRVRGILYTGHICRIPITLNAEIGQSLTVEASVFIPELATGERWYHPNFLGLSGFLNRIRFAVDPEHNHLYFGPASNEGF